MIGSKSPTGGSKKRLISRVVAVLALTFAGLVVTGISLASPASAACSGSLSYRTADGVAELVVYYSSGSSGTNCAQTDHLGSTYGHTYQTGVILYRCTQTSPGSSCTVSAQQSDDGNYAYYAGPVNVTGTNGRCIAAVGDIVVGSTEHDYITSPFATACH